MTVYVVQDATRYDKDTGAYVPKFDLDPARQHGGLKYLLTPTASPFNPDGVLQDLWDGLRDYGDQDFLLLVGNPCLIGWAVAVAAEINGGRVNLLQWHGRERRYMPVTSYIWNEPEKEQDRDNSER